MGPLYPAVAGETTTTPRRGKKRKNHCQDAAVSCRQCDFSAPFEWKRNLHPHCYKARMHSALACCTITSLLCCWLAGAVAVLPQFIAKLQTTAFRVGQRTRGRGSRQCPFSIDGVTGDVHMIDLMCCLLHINWTHSGNRDRKKRIPSQAQHSSTINFY